MKSKLLLLATLFTTTLATSAAADLTFMSDEITGLGGNEPLVTPEESINPNNLPMDNLPIDSGKTEHEQPVKIAPPPNEEPKPADNESLVIPMVHINPGNFTMGSGENEHEQPTHLVSINYTFEIGQTEVTQALWKAVMGNNPSKFDQCGENCPVDNVSWVDAQRFIKQLNQKTHLKYRLPTEAEWEYVCRAGGNDKFCGGDTLDSLAHYEKNSDGETVPVAKMNPNTWGVYDMSGNVWEWVEDYYHSDYKGAPTDGSAWNTAPYTNKHGGTYRVLRGGSWHNEAQFVRAANRGRNSSVERYFGFGFRLARTID